MDLYDERGLVGRVDYLWRAERVVGEADGMHKCDQLLQPGESGRDRVRQLLARDRRPVGLCLIPVHWGWKEAQSPSELRRILAPVLAKGASALGA